MHALIGLAESAFPRVSRGASVLFAPCCVALYTKAGFSKAKLCYMAPLRSGMLRLEDSCASGNGARLSEFIHGGTTSFAGLLLAEALGCDLTLFGSVAPQVDMLRSETLELVLCGHHWGSPPLTAVCGCWNTFHYWESGRSRRLGASRLVGPWRAAARFANVSMVPRHPCPSLGLVYMFVQGLLCLCLHPNLPVCPCFVPVYWWHCSGSYIQSRRQSLLPFTYLILLFVPRGHPWWGPIPGIRGLGWRQNINTSQLPRDFRFGLRSAHLVCIAWLPFDLHRPATAGDFGGWRLRALPWCCC